MNDEKRDLERESILLRMLWMVIFVIVWQLAELVLSPDVVVLATPEIAEPIALHTKCGFVHAGRMRNVGFKFGRRLDTVYMQCDLTLEGQGS